MDQGPFPEFGSALNGGVQTICLHTKVSEALLLGFSFSKCDPRTPGVLFRKKILHLYHRGSLGWNQEYAFSSSSLSSCVQSYLRCAADGGKSEQARAVECKRNVDAEEVEHHAWLLLGVSGTDLVSGGNVRSLAMAGVTRMP